MVRYSAIGDLSASTRLQRSALDSSSPSLSERPPKSAAPSTSKKSSGTNRTRPGLILQLPTPTSEHQRSARQRAIQEPESSTAHPGSISNGTRHVLVRRVQAVVEVPVKEESVDREVVGLEKHISTSTSITPSTSASTSTSKTPNVPPRTTELSNATTRIKRKASAKRTYVEIDDDESEGEDAAHHSKQSDADEYQSVSDGDDELLMGIEVSQPRE